MTAHRVLLWDESKPDSKVVSLKGWLQERIEQTRRAERDARSMGLYADACVLARRDRELTAKLAAARLPRIVGDDQC